MSIAQKENANALPIEKPPLRQGSQVRVPELPLKPLLERDEVIESLLDHPDRPVERNLFERTHQQYSFDAMVGCCFLVSYDCHRSKETSGRLPGVHDGRGQPQQKSMLRLEGSLSHSAFGKT